MLPPIPLAQCHPSDKLARPLAKTTPSHPPSVKLLQESYTNDSMPKHLGSTDTTVRTAGFNTHRHWSPSDSLCNRATQPGRLTHHTLKTSPADIRKTIRGERHFWRPNPNQSQSKSKLTGGFQVQGLQTYSQSFKCLSEHAPELDTQDLKQMHSKNTFVSTTKTTYASPFTPQHT